MTAALHTTADPHLAAFLVSEGAELVGLKRVGPKKVVFSFEASRELHVLLRLYWGGQRLRVSPPRLFAALRTLKSRSITRG